MFRDRMESGVCVCGEGGAGEEAGDSFFEGERVRAGQGRGRGVVRLDLCKVFSWMRRDEGERLHQTGGVWACMCRRGNMEGGDEVTG